MKKLSVIVLSAGLVLAGCGSQGQSQAQNAPKDFPKDLMSCSETITFDQEPQVMTVGGNALNFVAAAGAGEKVIARGGEFGLPAPDKYAPSLEKAKMVTDEDPTTEQIVGTGAKLVITSGLFGTTADDLEAAGVKTAIVNGSCAHAGKAADEISFDTINEQIKAYGDFFNTAEAAQAAVDENAGKLKGAEAAAKDFTERSAAAVYYFGKGSPLSAYGARGLINSQFELLKLKNAFSDVDKDYFETSAEKVISANPDVLVIAYGFSGEDFETAKKQVLSEPGIKDLEAVKNNQIVGVPANLIDPSPLAFDGLKELSEQLAELS